MFDKLTNDLNTIEQLSDTPNRTSGYSAEQVKKAFDENAQIIKRYINDVLIAELESNGSLSGFSGAKNIGIANREEFNGLTNIEDVLIYFRELIRDAVAGQIGTNDIKDNMLDHTSGNEAVVTNTIRNGAVTNEKLSGGITSDKILSVLASAIVGDIAIGNIANGSITAEKLAGGILASQLYGGIPLSKLANGYVIPIANGGTGKTTKETIKLDVTFKDGTTGSYDVVVG